VTVKVPPAQGK